MQLDCRRVTEQMRDGDGRQEACVLCSARRETSVQAMTNGETLSPGSGLWPGVGGRAQKRCTNVRRE